MGVPASALDRALEVLTTPALLALAVLCGLLVAGSVLALWALWRTRRR